MSDIQLKGRLFILVLNVAPLRSLFFFILVLFFILSYPCEWGGVVDGKPYVKSLEEFEKAVLEDVWGTLQKLFIEVKHNFLLHQH